MTVFRAFVEVRLPFKVSSWEALVADLKAFYVGGDRVDTFLVWYDVPEIPGQRVFWVRWMQNEPDEVTAEMFRHTVGINIT